MNNKTKNKCSRCFEKKIYTQPAEQSKGHIIQPKHLEKKIQQMISQGNKWKQKRLQLMIKNQEEKKIAQLAECTFHPKTNLESDKYYIPNAPFLEREEDWVREIDKKITRLRQKKEIQERKKLTFKPKISKNITQSSKNLSKSIKSCFSNRTYRQIHDDECKFKYLTKNMQEPFTHRRIQSSVKVFHQEENKQTNNNTQYGQEDFLNFKEKVKIKVFEEKQEIIHENPQKQYESKHLQTNQQQDESESEAF